jgi:hypothetical protein
VIARSCPVDAGDFTSGRFFLSGAARAGESARASFQRKLELYCAQMGIDPDTKGSFSAAAAAGGGVRVNGAVAAQVRGLCCWWCVARDAAARACRRPCSLRHANRRASSHRGRLTPKCDVNSVLRHSLFVSMQAKIEKRTEPLHNPQVPNALVLHEGKIFGYCARACAHMLRLI